MNARGTNGCATLPSFAASHWPWVYPFWHSKNHGERFTGLPSNHPLGHYFDALHRTGFYYTFIGVSQLTAALLLLIPRTELLGAISLFADYLQHLCFDLCDSL